MSRVVDLLFGKRSIEDPTKPLTDASLIEWLGGTPLEAGVSVSAENAIGLTAVYRAIAINAGLIGALPLKAYRDRDVSKTEVASPVIERMHPDMTPMELKEFIGMSLMSWGNAYLFKVRDGMLRIRYLKPIHASRVKVEVRREWENEGNPSGKRFTVTERSGAQRQFTPFDVLHIPGLSYDGVAGLSPIAAARQGLGTAIAAQRYAARMFGRGALIPGVLQTDSKLDADVAKRVKADFKSKAHGPENWHDIPLLDAGLKFAPIVLPPADVQYIEMQKFGVTEVARLYGLPPHLLADVEKSTSWGTGIEQQNLAMLIFTLDPFLVRIEQRFTSEILTSGTHAKFTRQALLRADMAARSLYYQRMFAVGGLNPDEIRDLEEKGPIPDGKGQTYYRPGNLTPLDVGGAIDDDSA